MRLESNLRFPYRLSLPLQQRPVLELNVHVVQALVEEVSYPLSYLDRYSGECKEEE